MERKIDKPYMSHPAGNVLELGIPLVVRTFKRENGEMKKVDTVFTPSSDAVVKVLFSNGYNTVVRDGEVHGNVVRVKDRGKLGIGKYSIEVVCHEHSGEPLRFKQRTVLEVVDATVDGGVYDTDEMSVTAMFPVIGGGSETSLIVITDDAVMIKEGTGFYGEITETAIKLYAREGLSAMEVTEDAVKIMIND